MSLLSTWPTRRTRGTKNCAEIWLRSSSAVPLKIGRGYWLPRGVPCCRVAKNIDEGFYLHPQALHLGMIDENMHPDYSNLRQAGVQVAFSETPSADRLPAPSLGQHSVEILQELGFSELEISDVCGARCIGVP